VPQATGRLIELANYAKSKQTTLVPQVQTTRNEDGEENKTDSTFFFSSSSSFLVVCTNLFCSDLGDLGKVSGELLFLDDEKVICVSLNQPEVMKALHK
jgi:hypothetical protein